MSDVVELRPLRVLVVEDSEFDYELLLVALSRARYAVTAQRVEDEPAMREALSNQRWDLIISDHRLPTFSAHAALRTLQSCGHDVPFIIVSGAIGEDVAVEAMQSGADDYILKDRLARLIPAIERSMKAAEARVRQRAAEAALRESEARLRAIAGNLPGMLFRMHTDEEGLQLSFTYASEAAHTLFGLAPQVFLDDAQSLHRLIVDTERARFDAALGYAALARNRLCWEGRAMAQDQNGERMLRWIQIEASPRAGEAPGIVWDGLISDISALKQAQGDLYSSRDELRRLSGHLERVKEQERARIAREIHDDIGGTLTGLRADLAWIKKRYAGDPGMAEKLESMSTLLDSTMQASVRIARDLRPPILDFGFAAAIEWQALDFQKRTGVQCRCRCAQEITLDADRATAVFRIFQELLTNIAKHAHAAHVEVVLRTDKSLLHLEVDDDGVGLSEADRNKRDSYGIRGMIERARELNGRLVFHRPLRGGTRALLELPVAGQ
ncbi:MAG TPA: response regulator [Burkholderiales bacterium]